MIKMEAEELGVLMENMVMAAAERSSHANDGAVIKSLKTELDSVRAHLAHQSKALSDMSDNLRTVMMNVQALNKKPLSTPINKKAKNDV